jgi:hypothetical protein
MDQYFHWPISAFSVQSGSAHASIQVAGGQEPRLWPWAKEAEEYGLLVCQTALNFRLTLVKTLLDGELVHLLPKKVQAGYSLLQSRAIHIATWMVEAMWSYGEHHSLA